MELLLEEQFDVMSGQMGWCTCEICRADTIALALNQLPPHYVVTREGELISKANMLGAQHATDCVKALVQAAAKVCASPRH